MTPSRGVLKPVRVLFNDGSTFCGAARTIDVGTDLVILSAPGSLISWRAQRTEVRGLLIAPGIRSIWVGRI